MDILFLGIAAAAMIFARRWKNESPKAGEGIACWGFILFAIYVISKISPMCGG